MKSFDVVVIGGGHNGLTAACYLAQRGKTVGLFEARSSLGGLCAGAEFHPGYRHAGVLQDTTGVRPWVAQQLHLPRYGLEFTAGVPDVLVPMGSAATSRAVPRIASDHGLLLSHDPARSRAEFETHHAGDGDGWERYRSFVESSREIVQPLLNATPPDAMNPSPREALSLGKQALSLRRRGGEFMTEFLRVPPMCVADFVSEYFGAEIARAGIAGPSIYSTWCGPWSPGTAGLLLRYEALKGRAVRGGAAELATALERAARELGVEIVTDRSVTQIAVEANQAVGVELDGGESVGARCVFSSIDPKKTFLELLAPHVLALRFQEQIANYRTRGTTAVVHIALNRPLRFDGRENDAISYARTGLSLDDQERAFDPIKYGDWSRRPIIEVFQPTIDRPELAPDGHAVVSVLAHFVAHAPRDPWTEQSRAELLSAVMRQLDEVAPGTADAVVASELLTPDDLEREFGVTGGHVHHGEHALDQLLARPAPAAARFATPVAGLFLCGSGSHPGGGVTCAPGALAAASCDV